MNPNIARAAWVEALRSGRFKQTTGSLADQKGHCCLGVACEVAIDLGLKVDAYYDDRTNGWIFEQRSAILPLKVRDFFGLSTSSGDYLSSPTSLTERTLADDNDNGKTFDEIADIIESEPERMFV